jgi:hypothetical protein
MKAHELLSSSEFWCQESLAEDEHGNEVAVFNLRAVKWCALAAIQKTYPPGEWEVVMDRLLRALSVSEEGIAEMAISDKACSLMEWNDEETNSFRDIQEILLAANV